MKLPLRQQFNLIRRVLILILPFGKRELLFVLALVVLQGVIQALGVLSIMPFLVLVTNPDGVLKSYFGQTLIKVFPSINPNNIIWLTGSTTIILLILSSLVNCITDYYRSRYAYFTGAKLGGYLLQSYASQPYVFHLKHNSAELIRRLQHDVNTFMAGVLAPSLEILSRGINLILLLALLLLVNPVVCIAVLLIFGSLLGISYVVFRPAIVRGNLERNKLISQRFLAAQQLLSGIKVAMIHNSQDYFVSRFVNSWRKVAAHDSFVSIASNVPRYSIEAIAFTSIVMLVLVLYSRGNSLQEVLPLLVFFVAASYRMLPALQGLYGQVPKIQSQRFALDEIYKDFQAFGLNKPKKQPIDASPLIFDRQIAFENITYRYPEAEYVSLHNVSFVIQKGSNIGIVGSSGAGKSTLVDVLIGLLNPDSGKIYIDEAILSEQNLCKWQSLIGYVPQDVFLLDDTVRNNIAFGIPKYQIIEDQVIAAAKVAQIHNYIVKDMPEGYDTICGERGVRLSGGQRQRIALARALYHQPSVLVFDEATSALDNQTERNLVAAIEDLPAYFTIITVAHRLSTVQNCDEIFVFEKGRLVDIGRYTELLSDSTAFKKLVLKD